MFPESGSDDEDEPSEEVIDELDRSLQVDLAAWSAAIVSHVKQLEDQNVSQ